MRAILVSVDYSDLLEVTLPYNRHHFDDVLVVTTPCDVQTRAIAEKNNCSYYPTTAFFDDGAVFNKWKALEQGLDFYGRHDLLCIMDADILWPLVVNYQQFYNLDFKLHTPRRRILADVTKYKTDYADESTWTTLPLFSEKEFAGYSQVFHCSDPVLGKAPWHEINWRHAGGADSFFQQKWRNENKIRPDFEVLHLGSPGQNWCGRVTDYIDGSKPIKADEKKQQVKDFIRSRCDRNNGPDRYAKEKI